MPEARGIKSVRTAGMMALAAGCLAAGVARGAVTLFDFESPQEISAVPDVANESMSIKVESRFATSGTNALHWTCTPWRPGLDEWPSFTLDSPVADWSRYDRMVVDMVNFGGYADALTTFIAGKEGRIQNGLNAMTGIPSLGYFQWVVRLDEWPQSVDPRKIARVHFFTDKARGFDLYIDRVTLLEGDDPLPQIGGTLGRDLLPILTARVQDEAAAVDAAKAEVAHVESYWRLRGACARAGQDVSKMIVAQASSMVKVRPRSDVPASVRPADRIDMRLARNEKESVQILVAPGDADLRNVRVKIAGGGLKAANGSVFPAANVKVALTGYVETKRLPPYQVGYMAVTNAAGDYCRKLRTPGLGWWPDPILDHLDACDVIGRDLQSFWVRVTCPERQKAGVYSGALVVESDRGATRVPFTVRVNDFAVPKRSPLPMAITFWPEVSTQLETPEHLAEADAILNDPESPPCIWQRNRFAWGDFLADYYITMDSLYGNDRQQWDVLMRLRKQGRLGRFNLGYWSYFGKGEGAEAQWRAETLPRLRANYAKAKELGIVDHAYLYGCDECAEEMFPEVRKAVECLKREFPGVPVITTAYDHEFGVGTELGCIDCFTPLTPSFDCAKAEAARKEGRQVWWYICCGPHSPYANMYIENEAIDGRVLMGAQTVRMRPDGFLYYQVSTWNMRRPLSKGPFTDWEPRSWTSYHGDGSWTCMGPGGLPLATQRLENFRDGLEDYAYALVLERLLKARTAKDDKWAARARRLLAVPRDVMVDMKDYTGDPAALLRWRDGMADLIEQAAK